MDAVFGALAALTHLHLHVRQEGHTLSALDVRLPMVRFAVEQRLRVLGHTGAVSCRRRAPERLHVMKPVPIRLVHNHWMNTCAVPWAAS
ncbi:MAG: putative HTH-type transcriptional regulator YuzN [Chloroflexi bacterium]|nr:putative HTH-type transcriptional regulator YuzN [Chloroflexota bacterium]